MVKLRILLFAEQNNPDWVSVPLVGFYHSQALAKTHRVSLVTHSQNKDSIRATTDAFAEIISIDLGVWDRVYAWCFRHIFKGDFGSQALTAFRIPFYLLFEWKAWRGLRSRIKQGDFDVALRLTPVSPVIPSLLGTRCQKAGLPFVIGPINGGLPWPNGYEQAERQKEWISGLRSYARFLPFVGSSYRAASGIIVGSSQTFREYIRYRSKLFFIPENGIGLEHLLPRAEMPSSELPLRLLFVGRLVPFKACDLALKAAKPLMDQGRATFVILGDGPERGRLEALVASWDVGEKVFFRGNVPRDEVMRCFTKADVLVFPSVREFGGGVVFEALATGAVPLVVDYGGPGDIINEEFGFKVPLTTEEETILLMSEILRSLDTNRHHLVQLAKKGQEYARRFLTWDAKAAQVTQVLEWAYGKASRPEFLPPDGNKRD